METSREKLRLRVTAPYEKMTPYIHMYCPLKVRPKNLTFRGYFYGKI